MNWFKRAMDMETLGYDIEDCDGRECVESVLRTAGVPWEAHSFPNGETLLVANLDGRYYVIDPDLPSMREAEEWLFLIAGTWKLSGYVGDYDFSEGFWHGNEFVPRLYHGTRPQEADRIMAEGLEPRNQTRGTSNRHTGSAVFTTTYDQSSDEGYRHGDAVIEIDTKAMLSDGYTPTVSLEDPIVEERMRDKLAWSMGVRDFQNHRYDELASEGIFDATIVIFGAIPLKYLRRLS